MQYRNAKARRLGRPIETTPLLVGAKAIRPAPPPPRPFASLATHVDRSAGLFGCWLWLGNRDENGYGRLRVNGRAIRAHRHALEQALGRSLAPGMHSCHHCDNPPCVNPAHLYEGTQLDNVHDAIERGRARRMTPAIPSALWPVVLALPVDEAAVRFGVSRRTIYRTCERARAVA